MTIRIKDRNARLKLCSIKDLVDKQPDYKFYRKGIYDGWGNVFPKQPSQFSSGGYAINAEGNNVTHLITMNYRSDIDVTNAAWIYQERLKSTPIWYRIISYVQKGRIWEFSCRIFEKSDDAIEPITNIPKEVSPVQLPENVKL